MLEIQEVLKATKGKFVQESRVSRLNGVSIDSRTIKPGELFVAVKGVNFDGHKFLNQAISRGAAALLVSRNIQINTRVPIICVYDTTEALGQIAHFHRMKFRIPVIALTGSAGKTTTKDIISAVLNQKYRVLSTQGTQNNQFGVPLTLLQLNKKHQVAVIELGTNSPGEIEVLTKIAYPTIAVLTNIGHSHLKGLKTLNGVFKEKIKLVKYMAREGCVVYNNDDRYLSSIKKRKIIQKQVSYGINTSSDIHASNIRLNTRAKLEFSVSRTRYTINSPARHNIYNVLAAVSVGTVLKVKRQDILKCLKRFKFSNGRMEIKKTNGIWIMDDTYNSNPISLKAAIETLSDFPTKGKRILVCADMLELGRHEQKLHQDVGQVLMKHPIDSVLTLGSLSRHITNVLKTQSKDVIACHFESIEKLHQKLASICQVGDVILIKGSRAMKMEQTVGFLRQQFNLKKG